MSLRLASATYDEFKASLGCVALCLKQQQKLCQLSATKGQFFFFQTLGKFLDKASTRQGFPEKGEKKKVIPGAPSTLSGEGVQSHLREEGVGRSI